MKTLGICLLLAGMILNANSGVESSSTGDQASTLIDTQENVSPVQWFPAAGSCLVVSGLVLVLSGKYRKGAFMH